MGLEILGGKNIGNINVIQPVDDVCDSDIVASQIYNARPKEWIDVETPDIVPGESGDIIKILVTVNSDTGAEIGFIVNGDAIVDWGINEDNEYFEAGRIFKKFNPAEEDRQIIITVSQQDGNRLSLLSFDTLTDDGDKCTGIDELMVATDNNVNVVDIIEYGKKHALSNSETYLDFKMITNSTIGSIVADGTFTSEDEWTKNTVNAVVDISNGLLVVDDSANAGAWSSARANINIEDGVDYVVKYKIAETTSKGEVIIYSGENISSEDDGDIKGYEGKTEGEYEEYFSANYTGKATIALLTNSDGVTKYEYISIFPANDVLSTSTLLHMINVNSDGGEQ